MLIHRCRKLFCKTHSPGFTHNWLRWDLGFWTDDILDLVDARMIETLRAIGKKWLYFTSWTWILGVQREDFMGWIVSSSKISWSANTQYLRMWSYLVIGSLQLSLVKMFLWESRVSSYSSIIDVLIKTYKKEKRVKDTKGNVLMWWQILRLEWCIFKPKNTKNCS